MAQVETIPPPVRTTEGGAFASGSDIVSPWKLVGGMAIGVREGGSVSRLPHAPEASDGLRRFATSFAPETGVRERRKLADDARAFFGLPLVENETGRCAESLFNEMIGHMHETYRAYLRNARIPLNDGTSTMLALLGGEQGDRQPLPFGYFWKLTNNPSPATRLYVHGLLLNQVAQYTHWYARRAACEPNGPASPSVQRIQSIPWQELDEWRGYGACAGLFNDEFYRARNVVEGRRLAVLYCGGCVVRDQCLTYALETGEQHGVWGGTLPRTRNKILSRTPKTPKTPKKEKPKAEAT